MQPDDQARARFHAALAAGAPALLLDDDGTVLAANRAAGELLGRSEDEARSAGLALFGTEVVAWRPLLDAVLDGTLPAASWSATAATPSGEVALDLQATGVQRAGSSPPRYCAVVHLSPSTRQVEVLEAELRAAEELFRRTFEAAPIGMALVGVDGTWLRVNRAICRILGRTEEQLLSCTFQDLTHPDDLDADLDLLRETLDGVRDGYVMEKRYFHAEGHCIWANLTVGLVRDDDGQPRYFISQIEDITARKDAERLARAELEHQVAHDPLTGLLNRRGLDQVMAGRVEEAVSLLFVDLDGFKHVNDTHGHHRGDELLCDVGALLRRSVRSTDVVARLGGDEFVVVLPDSSPMVATLTATRIRAAVGELRSAGVEVSATVGIAHGRGGADLELLLRRADAAMLGGKRTGKDRVAVATPALQPV